MCVFGLCRRQRECSWRTNRIDREQSEYPGSRVCSGISWELKVDSEQEMRVVLQNDAQDQLKDDSSELKWMRAQAGL